MWSIWYSDRVQFDPVMPPQPELEPKNPAATELVSRKKLKERERGRKREKEGGGEKER